MKVVIANSESDFNYQAAIHVANQIKQKPDSVIGLALGNTTIGVHNKIAELCRVKEVDFSKTAMFIVDEYLGVPSDHPLTGNVRIHEQLYNHINIKSENAHTPNSAALSPEQECERYQKLVESYGGMDLQMLGIGQNGHIGFNEPGTPFESETHIVRVSEETRNKKLCYFKSIDEVPIFGITLGIKTIMMAKSIMLLAKGKEKAEIIKRVLLGPVNTDAPASVLQLHTNLIIILDKEAAHYI